jgi:hypothetical protein
MSTSAAAAWDAEYAAGRYRREPPVGFTADIVVAATARRLHRGLYIGCGNGRNYVPLRDAGLDLVGLAPRTRHPFGGSGPSGKPSG